MKGRGDAKSLLRHSLLSVIDIRELLAQRGSTKSLGRKSADKVGLYGIICRLAFQERPGEVVSTISLRRKS